MKRNRRDRGRCTWLCEKFSNRSIFDSRGILISAVSCPFLVIESVVRSKKKTTTRQQHYTSFAMLYLANQATAFKNSNVVRKGINRTSKQDVRWPILPFKIFDLIAVRSWDPGWRQKNEKPTSKTGLFEHFSHNPVQRLRSLLNIIYEKCVVLRKS